MIDLKKKQEDNKKEEKIPKWSELKQEQKIDIIKSYLLKFLLLLVFFGIYMFLEHKMAIAMKDDKSGTCGCLYVLGCIIFLIFVNINKQFK